MIPFMKTTMISQRIVKKAFGFFNPSLRFSVGIYLVYVPSSSSRSTVFSNPDFSGKTFVLSKLETFADNLTSKNIHASNAKIDSQLVKRLKYGDLLWVKEKNS